MMIPPSRFCVWPWLAGLLVFAQPCPVALAADLTGAAQFRKNVQPILAGYCYDCHGDGAKKGGVAFDEFKSDQALLNDRDLWWNALKYLRAGIMPPPKKDRPTDAEKQVIADWIKTAVFNIDPKNPDPGRVTVRRLNRVEYRNTIRDLMGVDFDTSVEFPPDDTGYGFDDIGDVLTLSPMLLEKYIAAANTIVAQSVPVVSHVVPEMTIEGNQFHGTNAAGGVRARQSNDKRLSLPYFIPARVSAGFDAAHDGSYELALDLDVKGDFDFDPGKCRVVFKLDGRELWQKDFGWYDRKSFPFEFDQRLPAGRHELEFDLNPLNLEPGDTNNIVMHIDSVTVRGPTERKYWVKPKNFDRFFTRDNVPADADGRRQYAQEVLRAFASKAFRRPVDDDTVSRLATLAEGVYTRSGKSFEAGVAYAMEAVISSPRFLFRVEKSAPGHSKSPWADVDEYSLASRLSYFLWSTMPDDELIQLASRGKLRMNLASEVKRMMADRRSQAMVENFTGQWLQARDVAFVPINARAVLARDTGTEKQLAAQPGAFNARIDAPDAAAAATTTHQPGGTNSPAGGNGHRRRNGFRPVRARIDLDGDTRLAMKNETEMFFASIVREDRPVTELLDSDYTFLNDKLAKLYGLTNLNVTGPEMRRVRLPADSPRGGVLTEGTVLTVTSNPDRTSPVKRGLFVLGNILGTPAPPPPANVPALEASERNFTNQEPTLRATLELHRSQPLCASCHARMDPIGLAMENFNAMGMWRDTERNQLIEPAGQLITGESFKDARELKHILVTNHREDFYRCLTEKLLTYALGRGLEYYDVETVDKIVAQLEGNNGRFSVLLAGIIDSAPFQEQRTSANAIFADAPEPADKAGDAGQLAKNQATQ
jgi:hypothetical protein